MSGFSLKLQLAAAGLGAALLSGGCGLMAPAGERDVAPPSAAREKDKAAALQAFKDYVAAVGSLDTQRVVPYYHEPLMFVAAAGARALATRADMEAWLKPVFVRMKERGYARSDWSEFQMKLLSAGVAVVSTQTVRYKADGQELERIGFTYLLRKTSEGWKIAVLVGHDPANVLRLD